MKDASLDDLYQAIGHLGACGLPVMLDAEDNKSSVVWHIIKDHKGNAIGAFKKITMSGLGLIFYAGLDPDEYLFKVKLSELVVGCVNGRVFYPTFLGDLPKDILEEHDFKLNKAVKLNIYNLTKKSFKKYNSSFGEAKKLGYSDIKKVSKLYSYDSKNIFSQEHFISHDYYGVFVRDQLVGVCCIYGISKLMSSALIGGFLTAPQYRNKGVAKSLCSHLCGIILNNLDNVSLHVEEDNIFAQRACLSLGFEMVGGMYELDFSRYNLSHLSSTEGN